MLRTIKACVGIAWQDLWLELAAVAGTLRAGSQVDVEPLTLQKVRVTLCGHEEKGGGAA